jgi:hypothetical protein
MQDTTRVWVAQCLCPARHCILAAAGEADSSTNADIDVLQPLRETVGMFLQSGAINPWCGLCHSREDSWRYELCRTSFRSLDEAKPLLAELEREMAVTRGLFGDIPRSD